MSSLLRVAAPGLLAIGCAVDSSPADTGDGSLVPGEIGDLAEIDAVEASLSTVVPTVVVVTWTTDLPSFGAVRYGQVGGPTWQTEPESAPTRDHRAVLVGLAETVDAELVVLASNDAGTSASEPLTIKTGQLDPAIPRPRLDPAAGNPDAGGFVLVPIAVEDSRWTTVVDASGRLVWAWGGADLDTQRARPTQDGKGVVMTHRVIGEADLDLVRVDWDGTERWRLPVEDGHHDFDLVDDETFVVVVASVRDDPNSVDDRYLAGDAVVEVDLQGGRRVLWDVWDHFTPDPGADLAPTSKYEHTYEWSHGNYVRYDPASDGVLVTLRDLPAAVEIDRSTGAQRWLLTSVGGDFRSTDGSPLLDHPHSAWMTDRGLLVFEQRDYDAGACSRATMLALDPVAGTATRSWTYPDDECVPVYYLGNAQPRADGQVLVSFGQANRIDLVDPATGHVSWRLLGDASAWLLYAELLEGLAVDVP